MLAPEELDILRQVSGLHVDQLALAVMSNVWRTAQAFKVRVENSLLRYHGLSLTSFSTLFIVWIWGPIETEALSRSQGVTRGAVTGTVTQLESLGFVNRREGKRQVRQVFVEVTPKGRTLMRRLFPAFHRTEREVAIGLTLEEQRQLTKLLRKLLASIRKAGDGEVRAAKCADPEEIEHGKTFGWRKRSVHG